MTTPAGNIPAYAHAQWIGRRKEQEDAVKALPVADGLLGIVCDGMGGHARGAQAADAVANSFALAFAESSTKHIPDRLHEALQYANRNIIRIQREPQESGTTLLAFYVNNRRLWWISVGDSPLFLWNRQSMNPLIRLNEDHSMRPLVDALYREGKLSLQGALRQRSQLRSAVMGGPIDLIDCSPAPFMLNPGDVLLACSDGLQVWGDLLRAPTFAELQQAAARSARALTDTIIKQVQDMLEPYQDNATVLALLI